MSDSKSTDSKPSDSGKGAERATRPEAADATPGSAPKAAPRSATPPPPPPRPDSYGRGGGDLPPGLERKAGGGRIAMLLGVIGLLTLTILYLLSLLNSRTWELAVDDGRLEIMRGRMFPVGSTRYEPKEEELITAYAPVNLPADLPAEVQEKISNQFDNFSELNLAFFDALLEVARYGIHSSPNDPRSAEPFLERATMVPSIGAGRLETLRHVRGDLAYARGRALLEGISDRITRARKLLEQARELGTERYDDVDAWLDRARTSQEAFGAPAAAAPAEAATDSELDLDLDAENLEPEVPEVAPLPYPGRAAPALPPGGQEL